MSAPKRSRFITSFVLFCLLSSFLGAQNVIIIAVDTLRMDHMGCYGYPRNTSPNIDRFALDGIKFTRCYTPSPLTTPAFSTMLTSLPPHKHGAKRNGMSLFNRTKTLTNFLKSHGYYCGAFVSNWTLNKKLTHLDRGFDTYTEIITKRRWFGIFDREGEAPEVTKQAFKWLYKNKGKRFFLWVHYTEPHEPYVYHKEFDLGYDQVDPEVYPEGSHFKKIKKYDTEVGFVDFYIEKLLRKIKEYDLYEDTLIIFLADHGESFGEHSYYGHGRMLYNSGLQVPLIVKLPGNSDRNTVISDIVSLLDIAPTVLSLLGKPVPEEMEGENLFDLHEKERALYFEAYKGAVHRETDTLFNLKVKPIRYGLLKDDSKLILDDGFEAYDLVDDRFELENIYKNPDPKFAEITKLLERFKKDVQDFIEYSKKYYRQRSKLTKEELEKLKALGYIKEK
jgi:arylsulfatase A-like enzyme